jgi:hypothetical protein
MALSFQSVLHMPATAAASTTGRRRDHHAGDRRAGPDFINLYPAIYKNEETRRINCRLPQLTGERDHPGTDLPTFHFAFEVTPDQPAEARNSKSTERHGSYHDAPPVFGALTVVALSARFKSQKSVRFATGI